jgi:outer membrane lipoprotein-sorting protein
MKYRTLIAVVLCLALVAAVAEAQTVDDIFNKAVQAMGGKAALKSINTMKMKGKVTMVAMGMEIPFVGYQKRPNKMRYEMEVQGMEMIQATDGEKAWMTMGGAAQETPGEQGAAFMRQADIDGPYVDYKEKGIKAEFIGKETVNEEELYNVKLTYPDDFSVNVYFDAASGLPRLSKSTVMGYDVETTLSDYRQVGGILAAFSIEQSTPQGQMTIEIEELTFNEPVDDAIFVMPEGD